MIDLKKVAVKFSDREKILINAGFGPYVSNEKVLFAKYYGDESIGLVQIDLNAGTIYSSKINMHGSILVARTLNEAAFVKSINTTIERWMLMRQIPIEVNK